MRLRILALNLLVLGASAQEGVPVPKPPPFAFLRQNEDWSDFERDGQLLNSFKHVDLNDDGSVWASFGGRVESRFESWHDFGFGPRNDDEFFLFRAFAHADVHVGEHFRMYGEVKTALVTDRELPGGRRDLDRDTFALHQLFADVSVPLGETGTLTLRPGRQALLFGVQRLVSPLPWGNTLRTWDGVTAQWRRDAWQVTGIATAFVPVDQKDPNEADTDALLYGLYGRHAEANSPCQTEIYWLGHTRPTGPNLLIDDSQRHTFGVRRQDQVCESVDYEVETGLQLGRVGSRDVFAGFATAEVGWRPGGADGRGRHFVGADWASGDGSPGGDVNTFDQLYPLGHAYLGFADVIGRQNIIAASIGTAWDTWKGANLGLTGFSFWLDDQSDALYNAGGGVSRAAGTFSSSHIGYEVDLLLRQRVGRHLSLYGGYSHVFSGAAIRSSGSDDDINFVYFGLAATF